MDNTLFGETDDHLTVLSTFFPVFIICKISFDVVLGEFCAHTLPISRKLLNISLVFREYPYQCVIYYIGNLVVLDL
jgi:hypothetical protein